MNRCHFLAIRLFSSKKYSGTLNLPKFALKIKEAPGEAVKRERNIKKVCGFDSLYKWQQNEQQDKTFVLHDGPPYANGKTHVGHALNKILKDITNRYKLLRGYKIHYVPGWDCHGMPIEQQVLSGLRGNYNEINPLKIRQAARKLAEKSIELQKESFKEWGILADWEDQCYFTYDYNFETVQLEKFLEMFEKGFIYQDYMPVFWSPSSGTALAEAELEYNDKHVSKSIYVKLQLNNIPLQLKHHLNKFPDGCKVYLLIWTTTPWTIPANKAVCYGANYQYSLIKMNDKKELYIMCSDFVPKLTTMLNKECEVLATFSGSALESATYNHPLFADTNSLPLLPAGHVTIEKGTGLVHTAPAHGPEDFQIAIKHNLSMDCEVDKLGCFTESLGELYSGKPVLTEGNQLVLDLLKDNILYQEDYVHSYPYDWRSKQPVIYRASKQWFINTKKIKERAIKCLEEVDIFPKSSGNGMLAQLNARTYWCISRQRAWGVPIPAFIKEDTGELLINRDSVEHVKSLVSEYGTDCWWTLPVDELLPSDIKKKSGFQATDVFKKGGDVLDIWFDSGITWANVLKDHDHSCDVYLEGLDQFGGWFQSSLLTSIALQGKPPYKSLVVHGFTMDENGRKMSKSLGNVVDPEVVINGGKNKNKNPAYGVDVLRLWAAQSGLDNTVHIGATVLDKTNQLMFSFRNSIRYLLGNLWDFNNSDDGVEYEDILIQDKYMLHLLHGFITQIEEAYDEFNYKKVTQLCEKFNNIQISRFYCHITKDRMYCSPKHSIERRSCQTVQYYLLEALMKCLAPVLPHFCEEVYQCHPFNSEHSSLFKTKWLETEGIWNNPVLFETFDVACSIRDAFYQCLGTENPVEYDLLVYTKDPVLLPEIKKFQETEVKSSYSALCEVLRCSAVTVISNLPTDIPNDSRKIEGTCIMNYNIKDGDSYEAQYVLIISPAENHICERCRRYTAKTYAQPCKQCLSVMSVGWER